MNSPAPDFPGYVLVDIETTGLVPDYYENGEGDELLEVGITIADKDFNTVAQQNWINQYPKTARQHSQDVVQIMHDKSGLWEECDKSGWTTYSNGRDVVEWLNSRVGPYTFPMTGTGVHFDREFLKHSIPSLESRFTYRNFDIRALITAANRMIPAIEWPKEAKLHRALSDNVDSLNALRFFMSHVKWTER